MMKYKHVVFDVDGTLIDTAAVILSTLQQLVRDKQERELPLEDLEFSLGIAGADVLRRLGFAQSTWEAVYDEWMRRFMQRMDEVRVFEGIPSLLEELARRGHPLGVVTSKSVKGFQEDMARIGSGIERHFPLVVCTDHTKKHKPDPEPMLYYLAKAGAQPQETLYIGDTVYDMQCAQGAGVDCALALWGAKNPESIQSTYTLAKPADLLRLVD